MDNAKYFDSITDEIKALHERVRNYVTNHNLTVGQWKESIIRTILRRHLPKNVGIGNGFVVAEDKTSTQIDILLYDTAKPLLFQDGDLVIVTPDAVRGIIEVKTTINKTGNDGLATVFQKVADNVEMIPCVNQNEQPCFFGVFVYKSGFQGLNTEEGANLVLNELFEATQQKKDRILNCICIEENFFVRYWGLNPDGTTGNYKKWHAYVIDHKAPAYFAHNVIEHLCPQSVLVNNAAWYPRLGKEGCKKAEKALLQ